MDMTTNDPDARGSDASADPPADVALAADPTPTSSPAIDAATDSPADSPLATLCRRCGLCCDGNLFAQVPLSADEAASARRHALVVVDRDDGTPALRQRCAALGPLGCAVYDERPAGCRRYRCMLLAALADDEVSLPAALAVVAEAHALLAATDAALPATRPFGPTAPLQRAREAARGGTLTPTARAAVHAARVFLGRHLDRAAGPR